MSKILALAFVFFSVPGYAPWVLIGGLLLLMALLEAATGWRRAGLAPLGVAAPG